MPKALVVETSTTGHYFEYVEYIVAGLLDRGYEVVVATTAEGCLLLSQKSFMTEAITTYVLDADYDLSPRKVRDLASKLDCTRVYLPSGDRFTYRMNLLLHWPSHISLTVLLLRSPKISPRNWWRDFVKRLALRYARLRFPIRVFHLAGPGHESIPGVDAVLDVTRLSKVYEIPHEIPDGLDESKFWYAVFGVLDKRKNLDLILDSLTSLGISDQAIIFAGAFLHGESNKIQESLELFVSSGGVVLIIDRYLSEGELNYLINSVDCVICAHSNEGPSGIMLRAAAAGRRVLSAGAKSLQRDSAVIEGCEWVPLSLEGLTSGLNLARSSSEPEPFLLNTPSSFADRLIRD